MNKLLLIGLFLTYLVGCASSALDQKDQTQMIHSKSDSAFIIFGQKISESAKITTLIPMLYVNGKKMPIKGITTEATVPSLAPTSVYKGATYVATANDRHAYSIWEINPIPPGSKNILYIHSALEKNQTFGPIHTGPWVLTPMPITFGQNLEPWSNKTSTENFKNWRFSRCVFPIEGPGVYYLGDMEVVDGNVGNFTYPGVMVSKIHYNFRHYEDISKLNDFLKEANLDGVQIIDLHEKWGSNSGDELVQYINDL